MIPTTYVADVTDQDAGHADHVRRVASRRASDPVVHAARDQALRMWTRANAHSEATARRSDVLATSLGCAVIVVASGTPSLLGDSWRAVGVAAIVAALTLVVVLPVAGGRRLRPPYRDR